MLDPKPFSWTTDRAVAMVATNDLAFAESLRADCLTDVATAIEAARRPDWKSADTAMTIIAGAVAAGELPALARRQTDAAEVLIGDRRTFPRLTRNAHDVSDLALAPWGEDTPAFANLRFRPDDIARLAYERSLDKVHADRRARWQRDRSSTWVPTSTAARLIVQASHPNGEELAAMIHGPLWNFYRDQDTLVSSHGLAGAKLFDSAEHMWLASIQRLLGSLQNEELQARSSVGPIAGDVWARERADWWASSLGAHRGIQIKRADLEGLFAATACSSDDLAEHSRRGRLPSQREAASAAIEAIGLKTLQALPKKAAWNDIAERAGVSKATARRALDNACQR